MRNGDVDGIGLDRHFPDRGRAFVGLALVARHAMIAAGAWRIARLGDNDTTGIQQRRHRQKAKEGGDTDFQCNPAQRVMVIERTLFDRSWKATDYVKAGTPAERAAERVAVSEAIEAAVGLVDHHERENERTLVRRHKADHEDLEAVEDALDEAIEVLVDLLRVIGAGRVR